MRNIVLTTVPEPKKDCNGSPIFLTDETIEERKQKILTRMHKLHLDKLVIYGDVEHGSNFEFFVTISSATRIVLAFESAIHAVTICP